MPIKTNTWNHFKREEFGCKHCGENNMDNNFIDVLDSLRSELGFPMIITSGYRCINHPDERAKVSPGPHQTGWAADILVYGHAAHALVKCAWQYNAIRGIGVMQRGDIDQRFIHLDGCENEPVYRPRPWIWSY